MNQNQIIDHNVKRKTLLSILVLVFILVLIISIIGMIYFTWFWILILPLSFLVVGLYQAMSEHFWTSKKTCPNCNAPISIYSEFCRNCGLRLINKCPSCGNYYKSDIEICKKCNYKFPAQEKISKNIDFKVIKKGDKLPEKANFCPNCGVSLRNEEYQINCPFCEKKID